MDPSDRKTITKSLPLRAVAVTAGAALAAVGFVRLRPDTHTLSMGAYLIGVTILCVTGMNQLERMGRKHSEEIHERLLKEMLPSQAILDRKLETYAKVVEQLDIVVSALPDDLPEDARRAVWNIREEIRMSFDGEAAIVRRPLP